MYTTPFIGNTLLHVPKREYFFFLLFCEKERKKFAFRDRVELDTQKGMLIPILCSALGNRK